MTLFLVSEARDTRVEPSLWMNKKFHWFSKVGVSVVLQRVYSENTIEKFRMGHPPIAQLEKKKERKNRWKSSSLEDREVREVFSPVIMSVW